MKADIHLDLKLVSVKFAAAALALPTFSLAFWDLFSAGFFGVASEFKFTPESPSSSPFSSYCWNPFLASGWLGCSDVHTLQWLVPRHPEGADRKIKRCRVAEPSTPRCAPGFPPVPPQIRRGMLSRAPGTPGCC